MQQINSNWALIKWLPSWTVNNENEFFSWWLICEQHFSMSPYRRLKRSLFCKFGWITILPWMWNRSETPRENQLVKILKWRTGKHEKREIKSFRDLAWWVKSHKTARSYKVSSSNRPASLSLRHQCALLPAIDPRSATRASQMCDVSENLRLSARRYQIHSLHTVSRIPPSPLIGLIESENFSMNESCESRCSPASSYRFINC